MERAPGVLSPTLSWGRWEVRVTGAVSLPEHMVWSVNEKGWKRIEASPSPNPMSLPFLSNVFFNYFF